MGLAPPRRDLRLKPSIAERLQTGWLWRGTVAVRALDTAKASSAVRYVFEDMRRNLAVAHDRAESTEYRAKIKAAIAALEQVRADAGEEVRTGGRLREGQAVGVLTGLRSLISDPYLQEVWTLPLSGAINKDRLPKKPDILSGLKFAIENVEEILGPPDEASVLLELRELKTLVPEQGLAPAQFDIVNNRIVLRDVSSIPKAGDASNVITAREELCILGERLLSELERSNCDRRLLENVRYLHEQLRDDANVIRIGLANLTCEHLLKRAESELSGTLAGMISGFTRGVNLYVSQFEDWERFVANAAEANLDPSDISRIHQSATEATKNLEARPDLADPEVPYFIKVLNEALSDPKKASKRAAYAMLRTLSNLIAKVFSHTADLLVKSTAVAVAVALVAAVLNSAGMLTPIAGKITEAQWLPNVAERFQRNLEQINKQVKK